MKTIVTTLLIASLFLVAGCQSMQPEPEKSPELYQQLGERSGIADIVEDMLYGVVDDPRINQHFKGVDLGELHGLLTDQFCELSGGPCTYEGRDMRESHAEMDISAGDFNALVESLIVAMEKNDVPTGAQNRLLALLAPMYRDVRGL